MTNLVSRRKVLGVAGTAAGSYAVSGILNGKVMAAPGEFCDFVWPMTGKIIDTADSPGGITAGIKIGNDTGTPVYAARAGEVTYAERIPANPDGPGRSYSIKISHENGYTTSYLTNATTAEVEEGDLVEREEQIGVIATVGTDVPYLYFSINRQEARSIPGTKDQRVYAGEMIPKNYPGIECPSDGPGEDPGPGPIFYDLKNQKLALAGRIETISGGSIQEKAQVETVIGNLETAVTEGTISSQEANNVIRRLKLGEQMTERTIVGAGPATPDDGGTDYDIATPTAEAALSTGTNLLLAVIPFDRILRSIPYGKSIINYARSQAQRAIKWLITTTVGRIKKFTNFVNRHAGTAAREVYNKIEEEVLGTVEEVRDTLLGLLLEPKERLVEFLLNHIEDGNAFGAQFLNATELNEALDDLNRAADPATGPSFEGTLDGATRATSQGIDAANANIDETTNTFDTFESVSSVLEGKIVNAIITIATVVGLFTGGILSVVAQGASALVSLGASILNLLTAGVGWRALAGLRDNHAQTLDAIVAGNG